MSEFVMPSLGADMTAGTLVAWRKQPGDRVERGDIIAEVDSEKGLIEVEVFASGMVDRLLVGPGTKVPVGTPLAIIREPSEKKEPTGAPPPAAAEAAPSRPRGIKISPAARALAREVGVDPGRISGTGPEGAITRDDVERAAKAESPAGASERMRRAIAAAMTRSNREIPHYFVAHTIDMGPAVGWLERTNAARAVADRVLYGTLLLKATALALRRFPEFNGRYASEVFTPSSDIHVGTAVSLREGGLVIAAIHEADRLSLEALTRELREVVGRARRGQLRSSDLSDATITVTSLGDRGVDAVFGVIYPPQVALVGFGAMRARPWVVDGLVVARPLVEASLAADHRVSDGHRGARFLAAIEELLGRPEAL